jgi:hypothetical protein
VPELGPLGSVRGALSNERSYRDLASVVLIVTEKSDREKFESCHPSQQVLSARLVFHVFRKLRHFLLVSAKRRRPQKSLR